MKNLSLFVICFSFFQFFLPLPGFAYTSGDKEWWDQKFCFLNEKENKYVITAHHIFEILFITAGIPDNISPDLKIIKKHNKPWTIALEDGTVLLSEMALDLCYQNKSKKFGDSCLAFVLGHEIAHIKNNDYWHISAFHSIEKSDIDKKFKANLLDTLNETACERRKKEIQADSDGLLYAVMAGFESKYLFENNFFEKWISRTPDKEQYSQPVRYLLSLWDYTADADKKNNYPTPKERAAFLAEYVKTINDRLYQYQLGIRCHSLKCQFCHFFIPKTFYLP